MRRLLFAIAALMFGAPALACPIPGTPGQINCFTGPQDPSQLFVYLNTLINAINSGVLFTNTPNLLFGNGPSFTVNQSNSPVGPYVNGIQVTGGIAGVAPTLASTGSDTNVDLAIATQGNGVLKFADTNFWIHAPSVVLCPGATGNLSGADNSGISLGPGQTINGFLIIKDELGKPHWVPTCGG